LTDIDTGEVIAELLVPDEKVLIAKGGDGGFGNMHFKTSTNRAPRQKTPGWPGEQRKLKLDLRVLADVGLLGLPNAGKSSLITAISNARPKIADYPFTTLHPNLGVVSLGTDQSFVIADIPGLIEGAADGAGLGIQFLRHVSRTRLLLHVVDIAPIDGSDPVEQVRAIEQELEKFDPELLERPRWLVMNKADVLPEDERQAVADDVVQRLGWKEPSFLVSAISRENTLPVCQQVWRFLDAEHMAREERDDMHPGDVRLRGGDLVE